MPHQEAVNGIMQAPGSHLHLRAAGTWCDAQQVASASTEGYSMIHYHLPRQQIRKPLVALVATCCAIFTLDGCNVDVCVNEGCRGTRLASQVGTDVTLYEDIYLEPTVIPYQQGTEPNVQVGTDRIVYMDDLSPPPSIGDIVAGSSNGGYLRRVVAEAPPQNGGRAFYTEQASLDEAIHDGHFAVTGDAIASMSMEPESPEARRQLVECSSSAQIPFEVEPTFEPTFSIEMNFGDGELQFAKVVVDGSFAISAKLDLSGGAEAKCMLDILSRFPAVRSVLDIEYTNTYWVGFPLVVTHTLSPVLFFDIGLSATAGGPVLVSTSKVDFEMGAEYIDGSWDKIWTFEPSYALDSEYIPAALQLSTGLTAGLEYHLKLYDITGPQAQFTYEVSSRKMIGTSERCFDVDEVVEWSAGWTVEVPIFDISVVDFRFWPAEESWTRLVCI